MATRQKKNIVTDYSESAMEQAFAAYAADDARTRRILATIDIETVRIREKYTEELQTLRQRMDENFAVLQAYCENHTELFQKRRSIELLHGTMGVHTGTPRLKPLRGYTWAAVTRLLETLLPDYVRTEVTPAKDRLITDRDQLRDMLPEVGLQCVQDESFFVETKQED